MSELSIVLLASIDPTVRDVVSLSVLCDQPAGLDVRHELVTSVDGEQFVRCTASDLSGVVHRIDVELEHGCVSCTVREGLVPMLAWIIQQQRWSEVLVALPLTASPDAVAHQLHHEIEHGELAGARLARVVTGIDPSTLADDLLGDDLLDERGLALSGEDVRAVGEALAAQLDFADLVVLAGDSDDLASELLDHVLDPSTEVVALDDLDVAGLHAASHCLHDAQCRCDPTGRRVRRHDSSTGVWTMELVSDKPFHPQRLLERIEAMGSGPIRARGCFHLPSRPGIACVWDGSGGQLSIGEGMLWGPRQARTRIVVTGTDVMVRHRIEKAFHQALMTEQEARGLSGWIGREDGLEPWLGEIELPEAG